MLNYSSLLFLFGLSLVQSSDNHDHDGPCSAMTVTEELLEISEEYRNNLDNQEIYTHEFVSHMKETNDHSYRKSMTDENGNRRNLFSDYDDEIDDTPMILIPMIFHIFYATEDENLSSEQLDSQISVLNKDFRAYNTEILNDQVDDVWLNRIGDSKLQFYLNETIRINKTKTGLDCSTTHAMKYSNNGGSDAYDPTIYLNTWICQGLKDDTTPGTTLGYATFPGLLGTTYQNIDGIVVETRVVGSKEDNTDNTFYFGEFGSFAYGRTMVHEIGHYLNLFHVWGNNNEICEFDNSTFFSIPGAPLYGFYISTGSDDVTDTPAQLSSTSGTCLDYFDDSIILPNTCNETDPELGYDLRDMYENIMDYSWCIFLFTEEQVWRMRSVIGPGGHREKMYNNGKINFVTPKQCNNNPCRCDEVLNCGTCHETVGCSQCESDYFKLDYNYQCQNCQLTFGGNCLFCADFHGCQQCKDGSTREYDEIYDIYYCK